MILSDEQLKNDQRHPFAPHFDKLKILMQAMALQLKQIEAAMIKEQQILHSGKEEVVKK